MLKTLQCASEMKRDEGCGLCRPDRTARSGVSLVAEKSLRPGSAQATGLNTKCSGWSLRTSVRHRSACGEKSARSWQVWGYLGFPWLCFHRCSFLLTGNRRNRKLTISHTNTPHSSLPLTMDTRVAPTSELAGDCAMSGGAQTSLQASAVSVSGVDVGCWMLWQFCDQFEGPSCCLPQRPHRLPFPPAGHRSSCFLHPDNTPHLPFYNVL